MIRGRRRRAFLLGGFLAVLPAFTRAQLDEDRYPLDSRLLIMDTARPIPRSEGRISAYEFVVGYGAYGATERFSFGVGATPWAFGTAPLFANIKYGGKVGNGVWAGGGASGFLFGFGGLAGLGYANLTLGGSRGSLTLLGGMPFIQLGSPSLGGGGGLLGNPVAAVGADLRLIGSLRVLGEAWFLPRFSGKYGGGPLALGLRLGSVDFIAETGLLIFPAEMSFLYGNRITSLPWIVLTHRWGWDRAPAFRQGLDRAVDEASQDILRGRAEEARQRLEPLLRQVPGDYRLNRLMGSALWTLKDWSRARNLLSKALNENPEDKELEAWLDQNEEPSSEESAWLARKERGPLLHRKLALQWEWDLIAGFPRGDDLASTEAVGSQAFETPGRGQVHLLNVGFFLTDHVRLGLEEDNPGKDVWMPNGTLSTAEWTVDSTGVAGLARFSASLGRHWETFLEAGVGRYQLLDSTRKAPDASRKTLSGTAWGGLGGAGLEFFPARSHRLSLIFSAGYRKLTIKDPTLDGLTLQNSAGEKVSVDLSGLTVRLGVAVSFFGKNDPLDPDAGGK